GRAVRTAQPGHAVADPLHPATVTFEGSYGRGKYQTPVACVVRGRLSATGRTDEHGLRGYRWRLAGRYRARPDAAVPRGPAVHRRQRRTGGRRTDHQGEVRPLLQPAPLRRPDHRKPGSLA